MTDQGAAGRGSAEVLVTHAQARRVLTHAGIDAADIAEVLEGIEWPVHRDELLRRGQHLGITQGSLSERLGSSP